MGMHRSKSIGKECATQQCKYVSLPAMLTCAPHGHASYQVYRKRITLHAKHPYASEALAGACTLICRLSLYTAKHEQTLGGHDVMTGNVLFTSQATCF